ncbi:MAG TPA: sigma-E factor negative regulatory protein [Burkholderiales bacterium]|nr:sigma-E factor negative regulatory protein [Burkholderiales bacterium]
MDKISALMDGELDAHQSEQQLARLKNDSEARACWEAFHLIGDALRGERIVSRNLSERLRERLAQEPTVLAPPRARPARPIATYAWSAAASLSAVALVGWVAFSGPLAPQPDAPSVAAKAPPVAPVPVVAAPPQLASVPSEGKMNEYLIAHQEFSPSTAIQGLAPYIRTVSGTQTGKGQE